jgi:hypothetical protein
MKSNYILILLILLFSKISYSQDLFLKTGKNFTNYNYSSLTVQPIAIDLNAGNGQFYEFGMSKLFKNSSKIGYNTSLTLNEYNASAMSVSNYYSWNTFYVGAQGSIYYRTINTSRFNTRFFGGLLFNKMIYGKQVINNSIYDLNSNNEFNGVYVHPILGLDSKIYCNSNLSFIIGYQFSVSTGSLQNRLREQTSFINHQIQFGLSYKL